MIDTNVFIGACLGVGPANRCLYACLDGRLEPLMGVALFTEYEDVLRRSEVFSGSRLTADERDDLLDIFLSRCHWTRIYFAWRPNLRDEADNHLMELAIAGGAQTIVTRNKRDFRDADLAFPGGRIATPYELMKELTP